MKTSKFNSALVALSVAGYAAQAAPDFQTHTAGEPGFSVNSHLVMGKKDALLVDAQFTRSEARKVSAMVKASGKNLTTIFITHGHPDHYLGLEILTKDFPQARVLAAQGTIDDIQKTAGDKIKYWKAIYKDDLADRFVLPSAIQGDVVKLEGESLRVIDLPMGESEHASALYVASANTLITGDLAYNKVHLWLAEDRPEGWLRNLEKISSVGRIDRILPGHGPAGDASVLDEDKSYIEDFIAATKAPAKKEEALALMKAKYPNYLLPVILELSVGARVK